MQRISQMQCSKGKKVGRANILPTDTIPNLNLTLPNLAVPLYFIFD